MVKCLLKAACGLGIGVLIYCGADIGNVIGLILLLLWGIGMVFGFTTYLSWFQKALPSSLQLGALSLMAVGSGFLGLLIIIILFIFVITLGWMYGVFLCVRDFVYELT